MNYLSSLKRLSQQRKEVKDGRFDVYAIIEQFIIQYNINGDVLGIHARGTDFRKAYKGHPIFVEAKEYFQFVDYALSEFGFKRIFLATDDQNILDEFLKKYPQFDIIFAPNVNRQCNKVNIFVDAYVNSSSSPYKEGLNSLCDMVALAHCGGFISGISNLSLIARIINKSENKMYKYDKTINKGFHKFGITAATESVYKAANQNQ